MAKWEPFIFRETNLYHWIYSPVFTIQCTTVFELRQRKIADCFTKKNILQRKISNFVGWEEGSNFRAKLTRGTFLRQNTWNKSLA